MEAKMLVKIDNSPKWKVGSGNYTDNQVNLNEVAYGTFDFQIENQSLGPVLPIGAE